MKREWVEQEKRWLGRGDASGGRDKRKIKGWGWVEQSDETEKEKEKGIRKHYLIEDQIK